MGEGNKRIIIKSFIYISPDIIKVPIKVPIDSEALLLVFLGNRLNLSKGPG